MSELTEVWIVTDKDGDLPRVCTSAKDAETVRAYRQLDVPALGPHCVFHYRLVTNPQSQVEDLKS